MQLGERGGEFAAGGFHRQLVAADFADLHRRHAQELGAFDDFDGIECFTTDDDARLRFTEEQGVEANTLTCSSRRESALINFWGLGFRVWRLGIS